MLETFPQSGKGTKFQKLSPKPGKGKICQKLSPSQGKERYARNFPPVRERKEILETFPQDRERKDFLQTSLSQGKEIYARQKEKLCYKLSPIQQEKERYSRNFPSSPIVFYSATISYCSLAEVTIVNMCTFFKSRVPTIQHCIEMMVLQQAYTFCPSELLSDYQR